MATTRDHRVIHRRATRRGTLMISVLHATDDHGLPVIVASHVDRLPGLHEWSPPYNVDAPSTPDERRIRDELEAIASDLDIEIDRIVPMKLDGPEPYNVDVLRLKLAGLFGDAQRARWIRIQKEAMSKRSWRRTWKQVTGAGRMVGSLVKP